MDGLAFIPAADALRARARDLRFHPSAADRLRRLTPGQVEAFNRDGYLGSIRIFGEEMTDLRRSEEPIGLLDGRNLREIWRNPVEPGSPRKRERRFFVGRVLPRDLVRITRLYTFGMWIGAAYAAHRQNSAHT